LTWRAEKEVADRTYKGELPRVRRALEELKEDSSSLDSLRAEWVKLRSDLLLKHLDSLEQFFKSRGASEESARLRKGALLFQSDLAYLRENVKELEKFLRFERESLAKKGSHPGATARRAKGRSQRPG
jgi:hypothetical protein